MPFSIWKYPIPCLDIIDMEMPAGAKFLSLQEQLGTPTMWFTVDTSARRVQRRFLMLGTGHDVPDGVRMQDFLGTVQLMDGRLVFHLFECHPA